MDGTSQRNLEPTPVDVEDEVMLGVVAKRILELPGA